MAIKLHSEISGRMLTEMIAPVDDLLAKATVEVTNLSDREFKNRELKQTLLKKIFLQGQRNEDGYVIEEAETLFANLDNRYHGEFKKYVLTENKEKIRPENLESMLSGVGDNRFRDEIREFNEHRNNPRTGGHPEDDHYWPGL